MNRNSVRSLSTGVSEKMVIGEGRIHSRLRNFETVVNGKSARGTSNYSRNNLNGVNIEPASGNMLDMGAPYRRNYWRYGIYAAAFLVVIGGVMAYKGFLPGSDAISAHIMDMTGTVNEAALAETEAELERIANLIIQESDWNVSLINAFVGKWKTLDAGGKKSMTTTAWYQHFSFLLENMYEEQKRLGMFSYNPDDAYRDPLLVLALEIGIADPEEVYSDETAKRLELDKLIADVTTDLTRVEKQQQSNNEQEGYTAGLYQRIKEQFASKRTESATAPAMAKKTKSNTVTALKPATEKISKPILVADINAVLNKYQDAYAAGNSDAILTLFDLESITSDENVIAQLNSNFESVFENSSERTIKFSNIDWNFQQNTVIGKGDYNALIKLKNNEGAQSVKADIELEMKMSDDQLRIVKFQLTNPKVSVTTAKKKRFERNRRKTSEPTAAELQDIIVRFVSAYESGNVEMFESLFAKDVRTNDKIGLASLKEDYADVFAKTSDRQMFIQDLNWKLEKNHAKGTGNLEVIILTENGSTVSSISGRIQIIARRIDNKVLITHLYHLEH